MTTAAKSAKSGSCTINSVALLLSDWEWNAEADTPDATDSGTAANKKEHVIGREGCTVTLKGPLNFTTPQNVVLAVGAALTTINLLADGTKKYVVPSGTVKSLRVGVPIGTGEVVGWEATVLVNGTWTEFA